MRVPRRSVLARVRLPSGAVVDVYEWGALERLLQSLGRQGQGEGQQPQERQPPGDRRGRRSSPLDSLEDCALVRAKSPGALAKAAAERGLAVYDLSELQPGLLLVCTSQWEQFVLSTAEGGREPPSAVLEAARRAVQRGAQSQEDKYYVTLLALYKAGRAAWDGGRWAPARP